MMRFICEHGNVCRDCDECYNKARADSELHSFGVFQPRTTKCHKHPLVPLTENYDCILCCYGPDERKNNGKT